MVAGTVRRRGDSWQAILNFRDPRQGGKVVQFTATRHTKREADKALAELIVRRDREGLVRANQTFGQAVTKWREAKEQTGAPSSLLRYDIALRTHLLPRFGDVQLRKLTADMLDRYYADLRKAGIAGDERTLARSRKRSHKTARCLAHRACERGSRTPGASASSMLSTS